MPVLKNRAYVSTATTGTGTITLGSPVSGYQSFADAGVTNGNSVRYTIEDGTNFEIGTGTYTASGTTLSRTPSESSNSGSAINLSGSARVFITAAAEDIPFFYAEQVGSTSVAPTVSNNDAIAIGDNASATETNAIALSSNASATSASSVALGMNSSASGLSGGFAGQTALGNNSVAYDPSGGTFNQTALTKSYAAGQSSFAAAIDRNTSTYGALGAYSVAIGRDSTANNTGSMAIGYQASASTDYLIALGGTTNQVKISGTYTLPTADGSANQVLTTDGSGAVTFADAGGGGADLYAANESSPTAQPSATGTNAIAIGDSTTSSGTSSVAIGFAADASNTHNIAIGYNSEASTGTYNFAFGSGVRANASYYATAIGQTAGGLGSQAGANGSFAAAGGVTATGNNSIAIGYSYASGTTGLAAGITNNTSSYGATGANSIAMGYQAKATNQYSIAMGNAAEATRSSAVAIGGSTLASGSGALALGADAHATDTNAVAIGKSARATQNQAVAIGENCTASGITAAVYGSINATASGQQAVVLGQGTASATNAMALNGTATGVAGLAMNAGNAAGERSVAIGLQCLASGYGKFAFGSGRFAANGDAQGGQSILRADTTDATATVLTTNNSTASTDNQIVAASDTCITFDGTITAMQNGAQAYASWKIEGLLVNDGGTTTLANSATTVISNADGWGMALSADNTNNALAITCTGEASHNIRWVANIRTTEVTYA